MGEVIAVKRRIYAIPVLLLGTLLVAAGGYGTARAMLSIQSDPYLTRIETQGVSTELLETGLDGKIGSRSGDGDLLRDLAELNEAGDFRIGQSYDRRMSVRNDGQATEYVRVSVYRYWTDGDGRKVDVDPSLIALGMREADGWHIDAEASAARERTVMWYENPLVAGETTPAFADSFSLDPQVASLFAHHDGLRFHVQVVADAVQAHNAADAMTSAWGHAYDIRSSEGGDGNEGN